MRWTTTHAGVVTIPTTTLVATPKLSGKEFYRAEEPVKGVFLEVNLSRGDILRRAKKYFSEIE
jgi:hypothetical protein